MTSEIQTFLLAMTPIAGLRLSLPAALAIFQLDWQVAYVISILGNLVPAAFLLFFLGPVSDWLSRKFSPFQKLFSRLFEKTRKNSQSKIRKYSYLALVPFVALPLPFTGPWTASLIAFLYQIPFKIAFPLIALGISIDGMIILSATKAGIAIEKYFGWQALVGILLAIGLIWLIYDNKINKANPVRKPRDFEPDRLS